jgi:hypothetical protein
VLDEPVLAGVVGALGAVTVFVGAVTVVVCVGAAVVCWVIVVFTLVVWPTLSDWLVIVGLCLELFSETSRTITTIATIASNAAPMSARVLAPLRCCGSGGPASGARPPGGGTGPPGPFAPAGGTSP